MVMRIDKFLCEICAKEYENEDDAYRCEAKKTSGDKRPIDSIAVYVSWYNRVPCIIRDYYYSPDNHRVGFIALPLYTEQSDIGVIKGDSSSFNDVDEYKNGKVEYYSGYINKYCSKSDVRCLALVETLDNFNYTNSSLLEDIEDDIKSHGCFLTVKYWISEKPLNEYQRTMEVAMLQSGLGHIKYCEYFSEITGYLWTDENFTVGGHDLLTELESYDGKYLHMEIRYDIIKPEGLCL